MADATYWVDPVSGNDANAGTSYAARLQTISELHTKLGSEANDGRTIRVNLLNTGAHLTSGYNGYINKNTLTLQIEGVADSAETPALVDVAPDDTSQEYGVFQGNVSAFEFRYINFDGALVTGSSAASFGILWEGGAGIDALYEYCRFAGGDWATRSINGTTGVTNIRPESSSGSWDSIEVRYCVFENPSDSTIVFSNFMWDIPTISIHHCVFAERLDLTSHTRIINKADFGDTTNLSVYNNTFIRDDDAANIATDIAQFDESGAVELDLDFYNNVFLIICERASAFLSTDFTISAGDSGDSSTVSATSTLGNNVFAYENTAAAFYPTVYEDNPILGPELEVDGHLPNDVVETGVSIATKVKDYNSAYDWTPPGSAVALPVPLDARLEDYTTAGTGGSLPGALPAALPDEISYTVVADASDTNPEINDNISITFEVTNNSLEADADVELDVPLPAELPLSFYGSTSGTYAGGTWTVTIAAGATETLDLQVSVDPSAVGQELTVTGTVNSTNTVPTPDVIPTEDSVVISVQPETDFTVQAMSTRSVAFPTDSLVLRAAIENDAGGFESDAVVNITVPSFLQIVSATPSAGSFDESTGVWTLTIGAGNSELLTISCLVPVDTDPTSGDFTVTVDASSDPPPGGTLADDTDSTTIEILAPDITDPEAPAAAPFLDVLPIQATELLLDMNIAALTKRNRQRRDYKRSDVEDQRWRECSLRCIEIGPDTTTKLNLGGIERGQFAFVESSTQVDVSIGNATNLYIPARVVVLQDGDFEQLHIRNNSTTATATVIYGVTD